MTGLDETTGAAKLAYAIPQTRPPRTVWHRNLHNAGPHGSDFLRLVFGEGAKFPFPKSIYSVRDTLIAVLRNKPDALVLDFFAGSGTTLNALSLLNLHDSGQRRCILVTNNEVSEREAASLSSRGFSPGDPQWEALGICESVTWPRVKFTTLGHRNKSSLPGEYHLLTHEEKVIPTRIFHCSFAEGDELSLPQKREFVRLLDGLPMGAVVQNHSFTVVDGAPVSVLWAVSAADEWLSLLEEQDEVSDVYIVTKDKRAFNTVAELASSRLPGKTEFREMKRPLAQGLDENVEYFRLEFLDPDEVARGDAFNAIVPILWMMAGCRGDREDSKGSVAPWFIPKHSPFAVLIQEKHFPMFCEKVSERKDIELVFLITDSEENFGQMRRTLGRKVECVQLYQSYLENFRINTADALKR